MGGSLAHSLALLTIDVRGTQFSRLSDMACGSAELFNEHEAAIRVFEADETFNAALGRALTADGEVEECASVMDGSTLRFGSIGAAMGLRHPISVAREVLTVGPLLLVGNGAVRFAEDRDAELCDP